jgi:hypothetical protein
MYETAFVQLIYANKNALINSTAIIIIVMVIINKAANTKNQRF